MKKAGRRRKTPDILPECDFRGGTRGKFAARYGSGTNIVVLDPDVAAFFADSRSVNKTLRAVMEIARTAGRKAAARS